MSISNGLLRKMPNKKLVRNMGLFLFCRKLDGYVYGK